METTRCTKCGKRMVSVFLDNGRAELHCIRCEPVVDPLKTELVRWAQSPLLSPD